MTHLRALTASDYDQARALYQALSTGCGIPGYEDGKAAFAKIITHPGTQIIGLENADSLFSMATLHVLPNLTYDARPYALVENVATLPAEQGKGYGRQLMTGLRDIAWQAGVYKIMLLTNTDRGAHGFYKKLGYRADEKDGMTLRRTL